MTDGAKLCAGCSERSEITVLKVSVNIPTYNRAHLIRPALDSVLRQTYPHVEIIVIDDGSADETRAVVAEDGDRVRYFHQANGGLGVARNAALARSTGDCIAFLDSDDEWFDFKLALQVAALERMPDVSFICTEFVILKDDGRRIHNGSQTWLANRETWSAIYAESTSSDQLGLRVPELSQAFSIYTGGMYRQLMDEALVLPTTAIVRRQALDSLRFTEGMKIFEDWEFFARLARDSNGAFLDVETAINRGHEGPERLTRCSALAKAQCYLEMFERVWLTDPEFARQFPQDVRSRSCDAVPGRRARGAAGVAAGRRAPGLAVSGAPGHLEAQRGHRLLDARERAWWTKAPPKRAAEQAAARRDHDGTWRF